MSEERKIEILTAQGLKTCNIDGLDYVESVYTDNGETMKSWTLIESLDESVFITP